jgi:hypothetical protein
MVLSVANVLGVREYSNSWCENCKTLTDDAGDIRYIAISENHIFNDQRFTGLVGHWPYVSVTLKASEILFMRPAGLLYCGLLATKAHTKAHTKFNMSIN